MEGSGDSGRARPIDPPLPHLSPAAAGAPPTGSPGEQAPTAAGAPTRPGNPESTSGSSQQPTDRGEKPVAGGGGEDKTSESRRAAATLMTALVTAVTVAVTNDLTVVFEHSRVLLIAVLGAGVLIACVAYFLGDLRRGVRHAWQLARARARDRHDRRRQVSPILPPESLPRARDTDEPAGMARSYRSRVIVGVVAATALGFFIGYWVIGEGFAHGRVAGISTLAGVAVLVAAMLAWARYRGPARLSWLRPWRNSMLAIGVAALGLSAGGTLGTADLARSAPCPPPTELRVLASTEILGPLQTAITEFEQDERTVLQTSCYAIDVTAYAADDDKTADHEITGTWNLANGPRPDIWIPASTEELPAGKPGPGQPGIVPLGSIASSPIVIAVPSRYVTTNLAPGRSNASLDDIYKAISGSFTLALPNPRLSETGRLGIADLYPSPTATLRQVVRSGGYPPDSGTLLCQATQAAQVKPPAYLVAAAAVYASRHGGLGASGCTSASAGPLTVFSPVGGSVLDFPFATVTWSGVPAPAAVTKAEKAFFNWLTPTAGPTPLMTDGLQAPGLTANLPSRPTIDAAVSGFTSSQPPARILVAIDDSAPMQRYLGEIEQAVDGVLGPHGQGGDLREGRDSFGIWTFPGAETNGTVPNTEHKLVRLGPDTANQRALVQRAIAAITVGDHSAEFDLVSAAASRGSSANSLVLLTDGDDQQVDPGKNSIVTVSSQLGFLAGQGLPFKVYIIAFPPAGCAETPSGSSADSLHALANAGGGNCTTAASGSGALQQQLAQDVSTLSTGG
jgi:hypothetical protein